MEVSCQLHSPAALPPHPRERVPGNTEKNGYSLEVNLGGPKRFSEFSGAEENIISLIELHTIIIIIIIIIIQ
jgi:hypothetical protein